MTNLIAAYIVRDEPDYLFELSVKSVVGLFDGIVFVIDQPSEQNWKIIDSVPSQKRIVLHNKYWKDSKGADGRQRNVYLNYLKKSFVNSWCLVIDTDEVLSDNGYFLRELLWQDQVNVFSVHMEHFFWNLGIADATLPQHFVPARFFKITPQLSYDEVEHPILKGYEGGVALLDQVTLFHYGPTRGLQDEIKKYRTQTVKSNIHTPEQLGQWHDFHIMGRLPIKEFKFEQHPLVVQEYFKK